MNIVIIEPVQTRTLKTFSDAFIKLPLLDDLVINAESEFNSWSELAPSIGTLGQIGRTLEQVNTGTSQTSVTSEQVNTKLQAKRWTGTKPLEIQLKLGFYSDVQMEKANSNAAGAATNLVKNQITALPKEGHWIHKLNQLLGYSILSASEDGRGFTTPGASISDMQAISREIKALAAPLPEGAPPPLENITTSSKLVALTIPGIVKLRQAYINRVSVTYSKHVTTTGYPLWATADVNFSGLVSAIDNQFIEGAASGKQLIGNSYLYEGLI